VDGILKEMSPKFVKLFSEVGRPSIAPERLLRSLLLQIFSSVRSERMLIEQLLRSEWAGCTIVTIGLPT
jgi:transposase